jgi:uncharacterized damage-inducible protein DinB
LSPDVETLLLMQQRAFRTSPWHSLLNSLEGIGEDVFARAPTRHSGFPWMDGSIRDILYHVTGDKMVQYSQAFGDGSVTWDTLRISRSTLEEMLPELHAAHQPIVEALKSQTSETLAHKVRTWGGKRLTARDFFLMLIEHDLYHAGQIRVLRNLYEI